MTPATAEGRPCRGELVSALAKAVVAGQSLAVNAGHGTVRPPITKERAESIAEGATQRCADHDPLGAATLMHGRAVCRTCLVATILRVAQYVEADAIACGCWVCTDLRAASAVLHREAR